MVCRPYERFDSDVAQTYQFLGDGIAKALSLGEQLKEEPFHAAPVPQPSQCSGGGVVDRPAFERLDQRFSAAPVAKLCQRHSGGAAGRPILERLNQYFNGTLITGSTKAREIIWVSLED
jgi:hypothetical protein